MYSAFRETSTQGAHVWITQGCPYKLHHTYLYLANVRRHLNSRHLIQPATHLLTPER